MIKAQVMASLSLFTPLRSRAAPQGAAPWGEGWYIAKWEIPESHGPGFEACAATDSLCGLGQVILFL